MNRRQMLSTLVLAGGAFVSGVDRVWSSEPPARHSGYGFPGGRRIGTVDFTGEGHPVMETVLDAELDGRLMTDLEKLPWNTRSVPTGHFYIRTRASKLIDPAKPWQVRLGQDEAAPRLDLKQLRQQAKPMGLQVLECSGNGRGRHFGLLSAAEWDGVPLVEVMRQLPEPKTPSRLLVSGFDTYTAVSKQSAPGASWIFSRQQIEDAGAFLATGINGEDLPLDHGKPVRLFMPGWYGCTCIKWVNEIAWVPENSPSTAQMQEFAGRTEQDGIPPLAKDFAPAVIDPAAMPIRIEQWQVGSQTRYLVVGILWGQATSVRQLEIQMNEDDAYAPVPTLEPAHGHDWRFWAYPWTPDHAGSYTIRLRVAEPKVRTRRLDRGYYKRTVEIAQV